MRPLHPCTRGFTLPEVIFVAVILAVLARYAMAKVVPPGALTHEAQAHALADVVRRAQTLATVRLQRMSVSVAQSGANGRIALSCASGPCSADESYTFSQGVSLGTASAVYFNSLGMPVNSTGAALTGDSTFTLSHTIGSSTRTFTITVSALTGRVAVTP